MPVLANSAISQDAYRAESEKIRERFERSHDGQAAIRLTRAVETVAANWNQFPDEYAVMLGFATVFVAASIAFTIVIQAFYHKQDLFKKATKSHAVKLSILEMLPLFLGNLASSDPVKTKNAHVCSDIGLTRRPGACIVYRGEIAGVLGSTAQGRLLGR
jgi:cytochrome c biogenesis protein CcdA